MDEAFKELEEEGVEISRNLKIRHVCYADDIVILAENEEDLNRYLNKFLNIGKNYSIEINKKKTKSMLVTSKGNKTIKIKTEDDRIEQVTKFQYLGLLLDENFNHETDIRCNIARAKESFRKCKELLSSDLNLDAKKRPLQSMVWSIFRYGSECISLTKTLKKKITSFELWCYRRILKNRWTDTVPNTEVLSRTTEGEPILLKRSCVDSVKFLAM